MFRHRCSLYIVPYRIHAGVMFDLHGNVNGNQNLVSGCQEMRAFLSLLITYLLFTLTSTLSENMMSSAHDQAKLSMSDLRTGKEHCHRWIISLQTPV